MPIAGLEINIVLTLQQLVKPVPSDRHSGFSDRKNHNMLNNTKKNIKKNIPGPASDVVPSRSNTSKVSVIPSSMGLAISVSGTPRLCLATVSTDMHTQSFMEFLYINCN